MFSLFQISTIFFATCEINDACFCQPFSQARLNKSNILKHRDYSANSVHLTLLASQKYKCSDKIVKLEPDKIVDTSSSKLKEPIDIADGPIVKQYFF